MVPKAVTVHYRYREGDEGYRSACFRGRFFDCTEAAVRRSLREAHRFASHVEIVEVLWHDARMAPPTMSSPRGSELWR
jgi:hypothetical protein